MKQEKPMCWCCVWRDITGPDNDPTLGADILPHKSDADLKAHQQPSTARSIWRMTLN